MAPCGAVGRAGAVAVVYCPGEGEGCVGRSDTDAYECFNADWDAALVFGEIPAGVAGRGCGCECGVSFDVWGVSGGDCALDSARLWVADGMLGDGSVLESSPVLPVGDCCDRGFEFGLVCARRQEVC